VVVAAYVEELTRARSPATVKQQLAALRMLFDWLVVGQVLPFNPASSVRGPKHVVKAGKTSVLPAKERGVQNSLGLRGGTILVLKRQRALEDGIWSFNRWCWLHLTPRRFVLPELEQARAPKGLDRDLGL